jgi:2-C-methyl-D-erythritol 4-phosphate cytidylyltransferase
VGDVWGIVVAAGRGDRFGTPKQFLDLGDTRLVDRAVGAASAACDGVVIVLPAGVPWEGARVSAAVTGGATRSASVRAGLVAVPLDAEVVVVHDAARPLASVELFDSVIAAVRGGADGAVPGVPVVDTLKRVGPENRVVTTLERDELVAVQTPQAFRAVVLRAAHELGGEATDDAALLEVAGAEVVVVPGDPRNLKITTPLDRTVAQALAEEHGFR